MEFIIRETMSILLPTPAISHSTNIILPSDYDTGHSIAEHSFKNIEHSLASYRQDTISDINYGMAVIANSIKVISAIITILSPDNNQR